MTDEELDLLEEAILSEDPEFQITELEHEEQDRLGTLNEERHPYLGEH